MCGTSGNSTASAADNDVVHPAALAAAVIMIAVGIVIVVAYGYEVKKAWKPEQTYVLHERDQPLDNADPLPELQQESELEPVEGLDCGLSDTLKTSLIDSQA